MRVQQAMLGQNMCEEESRKAIAASIYIERKEYILDSKSLLVLSNLRFHVLQHEFLVILGPSGCGKTTLLRLIAGLDIDYDGSIIVAGQEVRGHGRDRGLVFQESRLFPWLRVWENISFALSNHIQDSDRERSVQKVLKALGLSEFARAWPFQLSGGMAKRVALARALVNLPYLLLLDEPFSDLDSLTRYQMQDIVVRLHSSQCITTILVTHDVDEAIYLADRIAILSEKPSHIRRILEVQLSKPRNRTSTEVAQLRSSLLKEIIE